LLLAIMLAAGRAGAEPQEAPPAAPLPWCAPELEALPNDVCFHAGEADQGRRTLVIFLHGVVQEGAGWQHAQQRAMVRAGKKHHFSVLTPRGVLGKHAKFGPDAVTWPTSATLQREHEARLVDQWLAARALVEERQGAPFDEVFVLGFSNGAYYAVSLAVRARVAADGYAVFSGGAPYRATAPFGERRPIFVGVSSKDDSAKDARRLARALEKDNWPHRSMSRPVGHLIADKLLAGAMTYLRAQAQRARDRAARKAKG
jgi:predicted esterase